MAADGHLGMMALSHVTLASAWLSCFDSHCSCRILTGGSVVIRGISDENVKLLQSQNMEVYIRKM